MSGSSSKNLAWETLIDFFSAQNTVILISSSTENVASEILTDFFSAQNILVILIGSSSGNLAWEKLNGSDLSWGNVTGIDRLLSLWWGN